MNTVLIPGINGQDGATVGLGCTMVQANLRRRTDAASLGPSR